MKRLLFITIFIVFVSCSKDNVTKSAKSIFQSELSEINYGKVELIDFEKINGIEKTIKGINSYVIEFESKVKAVTDIDFYDTKRERRKALAENYIINDKEFVNYNDLWNNGHIINFKSGDTFKVSGEIILEKTDNGWRKSKK